MEYLLHGTLEVHIYGVDKLHTGCNLDFCRKETKRKGKKFLAQVKSCVLCRPEIAGLGLYATVDLDKARVGRTRLEKRHRSKPQWNETFNIYCAHTISNIIFTLKDDNPVGATLIGRAYIPVDDHISRGRMFKRGVELLDEDKRPIPGGSKIYVGLRFIDVANDPDCPWSRGISTPSFPGIPRTYFLPRTGCNVTLYQDAHNDSIPYVLMPDGSKMNFDKCWEDIFIAIRDAKHFIYIAGWSVYTKISLVRIPNPAGPDIRGKYPNNLGELLKMKADEGVTVLMLVWDDQTSLETTKGLMAGVMGTHDQETWDYFKNTKVRCVLCPRYPDVGRSLLQNLQTQAVFTHHQKLVVVDSEIPDGSSLKRRVTGFIGGIDLCHGRYDIPKHPLFSTLNSIHRDDFHQPNFPGASINRGGPREPWHDIHCKLEGPVAWDVLYNFEQRWLRQLGERFLVPLDTLDLLLVPPSDVISPDDTDAWNVQLFRSIDGGAVYGFPRFPDEAAELGLVSGKNNIIDRSIQDAYIHAIRRAQNFIYIENQYFIGSSYDWKSSDDIIVEDIGALNLIPKEISLKVVSKIEAGQRFSVYIVIPMWPEGVPESDSMQAMLDWQRRTMEMMYTDIAEAITRNGIDANPRDYLTFFCLGNKEGPIADQEYDPPRKPEEGSNYDKAQKNRRFMIYVHSKMMIVDDEYIIVGSANINQRSMDGGRDTEIAMGAYQPHHLTRGSEKAQGQIYGFRKALWREHLGDPRDYNFDHPETIKCIRFVNALADGNWKNYADDQFQETPFYHLLRYPVEVNSDGTITALPGIECFPDTKAPILGSKSSYISPILTT